MSFRNGVLDHHVTELFLLVAEAERCLDPAGGEGKRLECRKCGAVLGIANRRTIALLSKQLLTPPAVLRCAGCGSERRIH